MGEPIRLLPCMHYYHLRCIDDWLMRSLTCPMCMERVDSGLMTTLRSSGNGGNSRGGRTGRSRGFSLRRRRRGRGQGGRGDESPLVSGDISSCSSSRSSSTSSSTEYLSSPGGQFSWQGAPQNSQQQQQQQHSPQPQGVHSETIFLPPFPTSPTRPRPRSNVTHHLPAQNSYTDLGPLPRVVSPQSSQTVVLIHSPPPPPSPNVTVHKATTQLPTQEER